MRVVTSYNNFSRAKIDHDMSGRFDLPIYQSGADVFENFISNFKGNAIYRRGLESMLLFQDCAFYEFRFSNNQNYILVFYLNKIRFLSYDVSGNFGWVLSGGVPLEVTTPYTLAQSKLLQVTQNADVMYVTHPSFEPYKLIRTAANAFTFRKFARKDDPFPLTWAATKAITNITQAATANLTIVGHGYSVGDRILIVGVTGMTEINNYTATVLTVPGVDNVTIDVNTTAFSGYSANGTAAKVLTGDYPKCCVFYKARLYYGNTPLKATTIWASQSASYDIFTLPTTPTDTDALKFTLADITQPIEWLFGGDNSLIAGSADGLVAINGGDINKPITSATVDANITSAPGCNSTIPIRKDGLAFYVSTDGRNLYYFSYDLLNARFTAEDANLLSYDITKGGIGKIRYKKDRDDLIFGIRGDGLLLSLNFKQSERINGWHQHRTPNEGIFQDQAVITDNDGNPQLFTLTKRGSAFYIERQAPIVEFVERSAFFTDTDSDTADLTAYIRMVCEQLKQCNYLDNSQSISNLKSNPIVYNSGAGTITATNNVFSAGDVGKHIVYKTATGYESGRFEITGYTSAKIVTVQVLQTPTANSYTDWYLTFSTISGLSQYNGTTIAVVTEGGFLTSFSVSGGTIDLNKQVTFATVGYNYRGLIKSFCLGFAIQGSNTQTTFKKICRVGVRTVTSAGLKIGSTPYRLEDVQQLSQNDINYLPPIPLDGSKYIPYVDDAEFDKYFYIVQDDPLPGHICALMVEADYAVQS